MRLTLILLLLLALGAAFRQEQATQSRAELAKAPLVEIEELIVHPERYDKLIIRMNGLWVNGYHGAFVCPINDERQCIGVYLDCPENERCKDMKKVLDRSLEDGPSGEFWDKRARLSLVGRFKIALGPRANGPRSTLEVLNIEGLIAKPAH